jgi:lipoprotein-anchoring transpeptidase ErfK/SrfK
MVNASLTNGALVMVEKIAYRVSASILLLAALAIVAMLVMGLTRADAGSSSVPSTAVTENAAPEPVEQNISVTESIVADPVEIADKLPLSDKFVVKRILEINEPFVHGYYKWDDEGVPAGELVVTVDLKAESISVFRGGYEIGAAVITFGDSLKPTPTGVFPITQKSKDHVSNIYGSPMPYMLRLTNDGVAIHATDVKWGWGTRGCIGVPLEFARLLFEQATLGDRVIVTNGKMMGLGDAIL